MPNFLSQKANLTTRPRSFSDTEAETPISKPPLAHKRFRTQKLFVYFALFTNPVKTNVRIFQFKVIILAAFLSKSLQPNLL
jgi:hypothetical protein